MIPVKEVAAFAFATFGESINPGPTLAALVQARTRSWQEAWGVVIGVALANIVWVIIVVLLRSFASELPSWPEAEPLLKAFAALILVFIATRAAAWAAITGTETYILRNWTTPLAAATSYRREVLRWRCTQGICRPLFESVEFDLLPRRLQRHACEQSISRAHIFCCRSVRRLSRLRGTRLHSGRAALKALADGFRCSAYICTACELRDAVPRRPRLRNR